MTVKCKLQNSCAWDLKLVAECLHVGSNDPQIFGNEGQAAQLFPHCLKESSTRALDPLSGLSCWRSGWNVPRGCEAAEVVQANYIDVGEQGMQPVNTPAIAGCAKSFPVVNGIAP